MVLISREAAIAAIDAQKASVDTSDVVGKATYIGLARASIEVLKLPFSWVLVKDRLPATGESVLCYCKVFVGKDSPSRQVCMITELKLEQYDFSDVPDELGMTGVWWVKPTGFPVDYDVTHWMPLPEKPLEV